MSTISIVGDAATTTALAIASCWTADDIVLVEADPFGGSLAAWLDVPVAPSLSSLVAARHQAASNGAASTSNRELVDSMIRRAPGGLRFLPCPFSTREAWRTVAEADTLVFPTLGSEAAGTVLIDAGRGSPDVPSRVVQSEIVVAVHHQRHAASRAAAAQLERFAEFVDSLNARRGVLGLGSPVVAVIGDRPFDPAEITAHVGDSRVLELFTLADDPMAAAVLAGRTGVGERRLRRQPLLRDARRVAARLATLVGQDQTVREPETERPS